MQKANLYIIGNANETNSINHLITSTDLVIRFNTPNPSCTVDADILFVANGAGNVVKPLIPQYRKANCQIILIYTIKEVLQDTWGKNSLSKRIKFLFRFPLFILKGRLSNRTYLEPHIYRDAVSYLSSGKLPSSGFLALLYALTYYPKHTIILHNFTFEGWEGHDFDSEVKLVRELVNNKQATFIE